MHGGRTAVFANWQCAEGYRPMLRMDGAGLAWEWLRRSAQYQAFWRANRAVANVSALHTSLSVLPGLPAAKAAIARLHFC